MQTYPTDNPALITEADLRLFLVEPRRQGRLERIARAVRPAAVVTLQLAVASVAVVAVYFALNIAAIRRSSESASAIAAGTPAAVTPQPAASAEPSAAQPTPEPTPAISAIPENTVQYGDLAVSAPVQWDVAFEEKLILGKLVDGVVHLAGTAKPGQQGSIVLFGHSSNYPWVKGNYNTVFAPLTQAKPGQTITMQYEGTTYQYVVTRTYEVKPSDLSVLTASDKPTLRMVTCVPIGTALRRLVVEAEQVTPNPASATPFTQASYTGGSIPGN